MAGIQNNKRYPWSVSTFNPAANIHVERNNEGVKIRFERDTLAFNTTSNGFSVTNDWNNRHFTLGFDENSILYHVTREDINDRTSGKGKLPPEEFAAEIYGYIRSLARPIPEDQLNLDFVGKVDVDEVRAYLEDHVVVHAFSAQSVPNNWLYQELPTSSTPGVRS